MAKKKSKSRSTKRQSQPNTSKKNLTRVSLVGTLLFMFALIGALADLSGANSQIRQWGQGLGIGLPFPKAKEDEILIIVTNFTGSPSLDAESRIYRELRERTSSSGLNGVRIERLEDETPVTEQDASHIGLTYGATLVIWGTVDSVGIEPHYTVIRNKEFIETKPELGITLAADLPTFTAYVSEGAPNEYEYLMLFSVGQISYFSKDYQKAIALFDNAIGIDLGARAEKLDLEIVYYYRGYAHRILEHMQEALTDVTQAININNSHAYFFSARGNLHNDMGNNDLALLDHNRAIELDPTKAMFYANRGNVYNVKGDFDNALQDYNKAISIEPNLAGAYVNRAIAYDKNGDFDKALADYNRAIKLDPNFALGYFSRGTYYYFQNDCDNAISNYNNAIEKGLELALLYYRRGDCYHNKESYEAALEDYNSAINLEPDFTTVYNNRGNVYHSLNKLNAALNDFNQAIELSPDYGLAYYNRGAVYDDMGNKAAAITDFKKAIELGNLDDRYIDTAKWRIEVLGGTLP